MATWKTLLLLALLFLLAALLYPHRESQTPGRHKQTIVYWGALQGNEAIATAVEEFERLHPEYHVEIGTATHRETIGDNTRFLLGVAGGQPPDVMNINRLNAVELGARGAFADLAPFLKQDESIPDGIHEKDYFAPLWQETCYQGKQYAISIQANVRTLFLNDDYLIRAGFKNPDGSARPPKSWEDICHKKFQGAGSVTPEGTVKLATSTNSPFTIPNSPFAPDDVLTLRSGANLFRARIKTVNPDLSLQLDLTRDLGPGVSAVPAAYTNNPNLEIKIFDRNSYTVALTRYDDRGNIAVLGFSPLGGNSWLLNYAWQNGADLLSEGGRKATFDDPRVKAALQFMVDCADSMGGFKITQAFEDSQGNMDSQSPFITGKMAMIVNGSWFLHYIAIYKNKANFTCIPMPLPEAQLAAGEKPFTWIGGAAMIIPAAARNPQGGWELLRFLMSEKGRKIQLEVDSERNRGQGQLFVPDFPCRMDMVPYVRETYLAHNPDISNAVLTAFDVNASLLPHAMYRTPTPISNQFFEAQNNAAELALRHAATVDEALTNKNTEVQEGLDRYFHPITGPQVPWKWLIAAYAALLAAAIAILVRNEIRHRRAGFGQRDWKAGFLCASPWLTGFVIFSGGPILFSLIISFCHYDILHPAQFVGLDNYIQLLGFHTNALHQTVANDPKLYHALANTAFMLIGLPISICAGLLLAMLLSAELRGIAFFRTAFYLPTIIPAVASFLLWVWIFHPAHGLLNSSLLALGVNHPPFWLQSTTWAKPAIILMGLWGVGGGMLIWLAGIKAIPTSLYEAAEIDGAGTLRQFFSVTLPMLSPYIFFNTVMGIIGTLQVFESAFIMTDGGPQDSTLFYCYYLFNQAFRYLDMGAASAMAWILFLLVLTLTLLQLKLSKKWVHYD